MTVTVDRKKIEIYRYSNYKNIFEIYTDEDLTLPGLISGYTGKCEFRASIDSDVLFSATTENGYLTVSQSFVTLEIPSSIIGAWTFNACMYDIFVISPANKPTPIVRGSVLVYPAITHI